MPLENRVEEWRDIPGYEGIYQASNTGRVRSLDRIVARDGQKPMRMTGQLLKQNPNPRWGYMQVILHRSGSAKTWRVHQLIALAFIGPNPEKLDVNHIDLNKTNNRADNLEYVTRRRNLEHAREHGLGDKRGEKHHSAKLSSEQVGEIRRRVASGEVARHLAVEYGIQPSQVSRIVSGKRWGHVA